MEVLAAEHGVCEIASLETWCLQMSLSSRGSRLYAAGRTNCWFGVEPRRRRVSVSLFMTPLFDCLSFCPVSISHIPFHLPLPLPFSFCFSLARSFLLTSCCSLSLLPWLLASSYEVRIHEDWWKIQGPMVLLPFINVLSLLLNFYLFPVFN